jgi:hypothetical protein
MTTAFATCTIVLLVTILALAREVRLRRALQRVLVRLLSLWRNPHANDSVPPSSAALARNDHDRRDRRL